MAVVSGDFVEMKELLGDNISLLHELEHVNASSSVNLTSSMARPRLREISSLASWLYCFLAYAALRCTDSENKHRLVYAHLIIWEAQRHGGQGWQMYFPLASSVGSSSTMEYSTSSNNGIHTLFALFIIQSEVDFLLGVS